MPRGIPNRDDGELKTSTPGELKTGNESNKEANEAISQENLSLKVNMQKMQSEMAKMSGMLAKLGKKTGVRLEPKAPKSDAYAFLPALEDGRVIVDWKRKPGSAVITNEKGQDVDMQFVIYTTEDGKEHEISYNAFRQFRSAFRLPCKLKDYLTPNEFNQWVPTAKHKYDDEIEVEVGKMVGEEKDFTDSRMVKVKIYVLNP